MYKLRPYQNDAIDLARKSLATGHKKPILALPTGSGKTIIAIGIIESALEKSCRVMFIAPRRELIFQTERKFKQQGFDTGVIMAGVKPRPSAPVQVASIDTINARCVRVNKNIGQPIMPLPLVDIVIVDECHLYDTKSRSKIIDLLVADGAKVIGLTATPAKGGGGGLAGTYDDLIIPVTVGEMINNGWLTPIRYYGGESPDTSKVKTTAGDYNKKQLAKVANTGHLNGCVVENWKKLAEGKPTVVFCVNKAHSRDLTNQFLSEGVRAEHLDCDVPDEERKAILARVDSGETTVLCNVFIASYGLDIPRLEVAVMARPTKSIVLYFQTIGRVLRLFEGKDYAIVIDHANCVANHGFIEDDAPWSLDGRTTVNERQEKKKKEDGAPKEIECSMCHHMFKSARICPSCGHRMVGAAEKIPHHQMDLKELKASDGGTKWNQMVTQDEKRTFYAMLKGFAIDKNYSQGWAAYQYKSKAGKWPPQEISGVLPKKPSNDIDKWCKSQLIRYAKSKQKKLA